MKICLTNNHTLYFQSSFKRLFLLKKQTALLNVLFELYFCLSRVPFFFFFTFANLLASAECTALRGKPQGPLAWCASSSVLLSLTFCMDALAPSGFSSSWTHSAARIFVCLCLDVCLLVMSLYMLFVCFCTVYAWHNTVCAWVSVHGCVFYTTHLWLMNWMYPCCSVVSSNVTLNEQGDPEE